MLAGLLSRLALAGPLDWLTGNTDPARGLVADPVDGVVPDRIETAPGVRYDIHNQIPLTLHQRQVHYGVVGSVEQTLAASGRLGSTQWRGLARRVDASGAWQRNSVPGELAWHETGWSGSVTQPIGRWRLAAGYDREGYRITQTSADPVLQPATFGQLDAVDFQHRAWGGVAGRVGKVELGLGGGWIGADSDARTALLGTSATAGLDRAGSIFGGRVGLALGPAWSVSLAGGGQTSRGRDSVFVNGVRHGRSWPETAEWRLGIEARGVLSPAIAWWGTIFHRDLRSGLEANATAVAPPLGALVGPRYRISSGQHWYQTGFATSVVWQAAPRTQVTSAFRVSNGRWRGSYAAYVRDGGTPEQTLTSGLVDQDIMALLLSVRVEQRLGTVTVGLGTYLPWAFTNDNLPPGPPKPPGTGGGGVVVRPEVPLQVSVGVPW